MFGEMDSDLKSEILATGTTLDLDPMAHLIRAQGVAIEIAQLKGLDPDNPRGLSRSVILK
jgi:glucosamine 6-phosphate synthetase-like amidotransferase/phosphosugar isomerase protein